MLNIRCDNLPLFALLIARKLLFGLKVTFNTRYCKTLARCHGHCSAVALCVWVWSLSLALLSHTPPSIALPRSQCLPILSSFLVSSPHSPHLISSASSLHLHFIPSSVWFVFQSSVFSLCQVIYFVCLFPC